MHVAARTGFINLSGDATAGSRYDETLALAERSVAERQALCRHADDQVLAMAAEFEMLEQLCRPMPARPSPSPCPWPPTSTSSAAWRWPGA
ncbi:MAG: hypothetical protein R2854_03520 [Caldilineaceae bacterium]